MDRETRGRHHGQTRAAAEARAVGAEEPGQWENTGNCLSQRQAIPSLVWLGFLGTRREGPEMLVSTVPSMCG